MLNRLRLLGLAAAIALSVPALAQRDDPPSGYEQEAAQAKALLERAVNYYKEQGDAALPAFSRAGEFITGELYVYVVSREGVMLSSGGPSIRLIGRDVSNALSEQDRALFKKAINSPEGQVFEDEYRWGSWNSRSPIRKRAYYERVGDRILAVGYYLPRSSPADAKALLASAAADFSQDAQGTIAKINNLDPKYYRDDLYVLAVDLKTERLVAHGHNKRLINSDFNTLRSSDTQLLGSQILTLLKENNESEVSYAWRNPITSKVENKTSYVTKVGDYLVAVGYYRK